MPQLYSWTVIDRVGDPPHLGALGISDDRERAVTRLAEALKQATPGAHGLVHKVAVSIAEVGYWYGPPMIRLDVDKATGDVIVKELVPRSAGWGLMNGIMSRAVLDGR